MVLLKFTCVLVKKQLGCQQIQLEKPVITTGAYIVSMDRKIIVYRLETGKTAFFGKHEQAVHSNMLPYFTGLLVILSLYCLYIVAEPSFIIQCDAVQAPCDTLV